MSLGNTGEKYEDEDTIAYDRDQYKEALEKIANGDVPGVTFAEDDLISAFAQRVLDET